MAAARMAAQAARQVTSNGEWVGPSGTSGTNTKKPDKPSASWSSDGQHTEYEYDNRGNCISKSYYDAEGKKTETRHFQYNSNGDVVYLEDRNSAGDCIYQEKFEYEGRKIINRKIYTLGSLNMEEKFVS